MHARYVLLIAMSAFGCGGSTSDNTVPASGDTGSASDGSGGDAADTGSGDTGSSGDTTTGNDTATGDTGSGGGGEGGLSCGASTCAAGEVCCATPSGMTVSLTCSKTGCPDGGSTISCDSPDSCTTPGKGICCAEADVTGSGFMCAFVSGTAECRATCNTMIPTMCPGKATVRPCKKTADCAGEPSYKNCCNFMGGGSSATFCAPDFMKGFATKCF